MAFSAKQAQAQKDDKMDDKDDEYGKQQRLGHCVSIPVGDCIELFPPYARAGANVKFSFLAFQLSEAEKAGVVSNCGHLKHLKFSKDLPHVFTG